MNQNILTTILIAGMGAVLVTMVLGVINMFRGKSSLKSNKLMQIRIGLQVLVLLMFAFLLWTSRG